MPYFIGDILELPVTTVQDYTLFHLLDEHSTDLWKTQVEMILKKSGMASFIIHPDYVSQPKPRAVYLELLEYLQELRETRNLWFALPGAIDQWWRARSQMFLLRNGNSWRIEGDRADQAVVAYARAIDGRLHYEFDKPDGTFEAE